MDHSHSHEGHSHSHQRQAGPGERNCSVFGSGAPLARIKKVGEMGFVPGDLSSRLII
jgi:hypothetical protein